jgi:hypothetical protein
MRRVLLFVVALPIVLALSLPGAASASALNGLTITPSIVNNGASATGDITLAFADPSPTTVLLFSSDPSAAQVPASIVVPPFTREAFFTITTNAAAPFTPIQIMAAVDNVPRTANMEVNPAPPAGPTLKSVSAVPTTIVGTANSTGTVTFTGAMTQGAVVNLSSSNPAVATVPSETVVSQNRSTSTFNIATSRVTAATPVRITATWFGNTATVTVTVTPGTPPPPDVVRITKAQWKQVGINGQLTVQATSTNPNAILSVFIGGGFAFDLTNDGGGRYSGQFLWKQPPHPPIVVRSNMGGSASSNT